MDYLLSIITVTRNNSSALRDTIINVSNTIPSNCEHIVIDGASSDDTANILSYNWSHNLKYISEPDNGIYDAMNKGIKLSNAKWLLFLNSGDYLFQDDFLKVLNLLENTEFDFIFFKQVDKEGQYTNFYQRRFSMPTSHQGQLYKKSILDKNQFDTKYRVGADFDLYKKLVSNNNIITYFSNLSISYVSPPGFSKVNENILKNDYFSIINKYEGFIYAYLYKYLIGDAISARIKNLFPKRIRSFARNLLKL